MRLDHTFSSAARTSARTCARALAGAVLPALLLATAACKEKNSYAPPPPPKVSVATPTKREATRYLELNGSVQAVNTVNLVARVEGYLREIGYQDGAAVKAGTALFTIEPDPYFAKLQQAQAQEAAAQAVLAQANQEFSRQSTLARDDFASQSKLDEARKARDTASANLRNEQAATQIAAINYTYTRVNAPFDGVVTQRLVSVGELVGGASPTKLATIVQLQPIYVAFNVSELDVLAIRKSLAARGVERLDVSKVPVEVGLADEKGYPHAGRLDYIAPAVDAATGTLLVRGVFANEDRALMPGNFVRVRVPVQRDPDALFVPDTAVGGDQGGRYVLVVGADGVVEQKYVAIGQLDGDMRVVESGLAPTDRVVVGGIQRAVPGARVEAAVSTAAR